MRGAGSLGDNAESSFFFAELADGGPEPVKVTASSEAILR